MFLLLFFLLLLASCPFDAVAMMHCDRGVCLMLLCCQIPLAVSLAEGRQMGYIMKAIENLAGHFNEHKLVINTTLAKSILGGVLGIPPVYSGTFLFASLFIFSIHAQFIFNVCMFSQRWAIACY